MAASPFRSGRPSPYVVAGAIAAAGALLLIVQWAHGRMLWLDEEMIAINVRDRSMRQLAGPLWLAQTAPYGWLVLQRAMLQLFGTSERALRFVPIAFGVGTLATAVWIGRRWMTPFGAAALAFLCAIGQGLSFNALQLKHYSADAWAALLLPAMAARAIEPSDAATMRRRVLAWWLVAAVAQSIAYGALFVAPACAMLIVAAAWRRLGWRGALVALVPGVIWLAAFAAHYVVALEPARSDPFLSHYWREAFPPPGAGLVHAVAWLARQLKPLAENPGGTRYALVFWIAAAAGYAANRRSPLAVRLAFASVPLSAFALAAARLVPLSGRLALWIAPALYVGIAMSFNVAVSSLAAGASGRGWVRLTAGAAGIAALAAIGVDVFDQGMTDVTLRKAVANHALDDRGAITWLARQRHDGDAWVTTHEALPAVWWYARDAAPLVEASHRGVYSECGSQEIVSWMRARGHRRALVYLGFGHDSNNPLVDTLLASLGSIGRVAQYRRFGEISHAVVFDFEQPSAFPPTLARLAASPYAAAGSSVHGCIAISPAQRW